MTYLEDVSTHSRAEAAALFYQKQNKVRRVSTHSRAEAAAHTFFYTLCPQHSFNTQPRGGGCGRIFLVGRTYGKVSTHSRAEAAAHLIYNNL